MAQQPQKRPQDGISGIAGLSPEALSGMRSLIENGVGESFHLLINVNSRQVSIVDFTAGVSSPQEEVTFEVRTAHSAFGRKPPEAAIIYSQAVKGSQARELVKKAAILLRASKEDFGLKDETPINLRLSPTGGIRASRLASAGNGAPFPEVVPHAIIMGNQTGGRMPTLKELAILGTAAD